MPRLSCSGCQLAVINTARPEDRTGFLHPNLKEWANDNRGELVWAFLILAKGWIDSGQPAPSINPLGMFEEWTRVIGGILEHAGYTDFMGNRAYIREEADPRAQTLSAFCVKWFETHESREVTATRLLDVADTVEGMWIKGGSNELARANSLGWYLRQNTSVVVEEIVEEGETARCFQIKRAGNKGGSKLWRLELLNDADRKEQQFGALIDRSSKVCGYNHVAFDNKKVAACWNITWDHSKNYDLMIEARRANGLDVDNFQPPGPGNFFKLADLAMATLGITKRDKGAGAPALFQRGQLGELLDYAVMDTYLTYRLLSLVLKGEPLIHPGSSAKLTLRHPLEKAEPPPQIRTPAPPRIDTARAYIERRRAEMDRRRAEMHAEFLEKDRQLKETGQRLRAGVR